MSVVAAKIYKDKVKFAADSIIVNGSFKKTNYNKKHQKYGKSVQMSYDDALTLSHWRMDDGRYKNFLFVIDSNE